MSFIKEIQRKSGFSRFKKFILARRMLEKSFNFGVRKRNIYPTSETPIHIFKSFIQVFTYARKKSGRKKRIFKPNFLTLISSAGKNLYEGFKNMYWGF